MERISREAAAVPDAWFGAFRIGPDASEFSRLLHLLRVDSGDIYSGQLPRTLHLCESVESGGVQILSKLAAPVRFADILGLFATILTHSRLCRTGVARMSEPGFWLREEGSPPRPALPLVHLSGATGMTEAEIQILIAPLVGDGALRAVCGDDGAAAVVAVDGFINDGPVRRFLKF
ncbi:hypothetical protein [Defluviimonas salinarum]|uniref:PAS domain-containing protein n=1 Tax=Defluviimonas salinarum TaxID=2992147 RepID=A0ABT3J4H9_9RHOB|nr:hypothetical protein [Defluviimonas salinarum]MCW3782601.1 hypothetical protein [Defluviimonas salinarum]